MSKSSDFPNRDRRDLLKKITAFTPVILSIYNLFIVINLPVFDYERFLDRATRELEGRGFVRRLIDHLTGFLWQHSTADQIAQHDIFWDQCWGVIYFFLSLAFAWVVLNWALAKSVIAGLSLIAFSIFYYFNPVDFLPDILPFAGSVDDLIVVIFSTAIGISLMGDAKKQQ